MIFVDLRRHTLPARSGSRSAAARRESPVCLAAKLEAFESLSLCAEIAIAITGFSGVVLVFGDRADVERSPLDRALFRTLFTATFIPIGLVALALILDAAAVAQPTIWRACSIVQALAVSATMIYNARASASQGWNNLDSRFPRAVIRVGSSVLAVALLIMCLQIANAISLHAFWPVLVAVWWGIAVGLFAFTSLVLLSRSAQSSSS